MDFFYWGGPVYCSTAQKLVWERPTHVFCKPLEGSSNGSFASTLGQDPIGSLLAKAGVAAGGSVGFGGFSAFHGLLDPVLRLQADRVDYVHLADACFQGSGATEPKPGLLAFAKRAASGKARMTVTTNGPWDKDISYWGPAGSKYEGTQFNLTSGAKCFHNVWRAATGDAGEGTAELPAGVPAPDKTFHVGELYWFHYEGKGQKDPHGWHTNVLAQPFMQQYGVPWMAGHRGGLTLPGLPGLGSGGATPGLIVGGMAAAAVAAAAVYLLARRGGYVPNAFEGEFPKMCNCCGRVYRDHRAWRRLELRGRRNFPWGEIGEFRNCVCGSTLYVTVVRGQEATG